METFLLIEEDDSQQVQFLTLALEKAGLPASAYFFCRDGLTMISFLERAEPPLGRMPIPSRIITDLRMPLMDGLGVLMWAKKNPHFKHLPVTLMSSLLSPELILRAEALGAAEIVEKRASLNDLTDLIRGWCGTPGSAASPQSPAILKSEALRMGSSAIAPPL